MRRKFCTSISTDDAVGFSRPRRGQELDHKFLLQHDSKVLEIDEGMSNWKIRYQARGATNVTSIVVGVEEMPGQAGWWREA